MRSAHVKVFGVVCDKPEIRGSFREFYAHLSSASLTPTKTGYAATSFGLVFGILDSKPLAYPHFR